MTLARLLGYLPRGNTLDEATFQRRHKFLLIILGMHIPAILGFGLWLEHSLSTSTYVAITPAMCVVAGYLVPQRRVASFLVVVGLTYSAAAFTVLAAGAIEAHFHFFVIIGLIALYQDWVPFMWNILFTVLSHGLGSAYDPGLIFNHEAALNSPWVWSLLHGSAVLAACIGVVVFWRETENEQQQTLALTKQLADAELAQRKFTSELLVNLARRNQSMLYRQLDILNQLEEKERDPDALSELFRLDHLATRIRRNAESLLVLSGEEPTRVWSEPVRLIDVVRAAIAETEDLDRVAFAVDERIEVLGHIVTDLTHVLAELTENAVRFSPPEANVTIRTRPYLKMPGAAVLTVEDWGVGMRPDDMTSANELLAHPREVDLSVSQRLGLHVVARLAARHEIQVSLTPTPGTGVTAVVVLPAELFASSPQQLTPRTVGTANGAAADSTSPTRPGPPPSAEPVDGLGRTGFTPPSSAPVSPDIPLPRRTTSAPGSTPTPNGAPVPSPAMPNGGHAPNGSPTTNGHSDDRGLHARPDQEEQPPHWAGWWTPARFPDGLPSEWQPPPVYATAEPVVSDPPGVTGTTPALPAGPTRSSDPSDPAIIARAPQPGTDRAAAARASEEVSAITDTDPDILLNRRVPQANLAPELRRGGPQESPLDSSPPPDAQLARDALSRFQASRQAAQQHVGDSGNR